MRLTTDNIGLEEDHDASPSLYYPRHKAVLLL